jgi:hypothetical protein
MSGYAHVRNGSFASVWLRTDNFRSTPKNRHRHRPSHISKVPTADFIPCAEKANPSVRQTWVRQFGRGGLRGRDRPSFLLLRNRSLSPLHERLHLLLGQLAILVAVHCLEIRS